MFPKHDEAVDTVNASAEAVFARLDDRTHLPAYMSKRSWKMRRSSTRRSPAFA